MIYKQNEPFTCGPCSYMEAFGGLKNIKREMKLHEKGRILPSRIFLGISFLEINKSLKLYIETKELSKEIIDLVYYHKVKNFKKKFINYYKMLLKKHYDNIFLINEKKIIEILNQTSKKKTRKAMLLTDSSYWTKSGTVHWIAFRSLNNGKYNFGDPKTGKIVRFSQEDLRKIFKLVHKGGFPLQIVTNFEGEI